MNLNRKLEKRRKTNRENLVRFFSGSRSTYSRDLGHHNVPNSVDLDLFTSNDLLKILKTYNNHRVEFERILKYARRFKQAVGEMDLEDIEAVKLLLAVQNVMEE